MDNPDAELAATGDDGSDGDVGDVSVDDYRDYGSPKEHSDSEFIDVYYHPVKEEPESELDHGDGDTVDNYCDYGSLKRELEPEFADSGGDGGASDDGDSNHDCGPPKEEPQPEFPATGDDAVPGDGRDVGYECSHCRISLSTRAFKVEHELRCKVRMQRGELESQVTMLYQCGYCRCPFLSKNYKDQHEQRGCQKRPVAMRKTNSNGTYFKCDKCKFVSKYRMSLANHVLTHNKNNAEWFACTQCSYKTVHKSTMTRHMKIHNNTFSCCCPVCGKIFRTKYQLDDHLLRQHSDESDEVSKLITRKTYTCNICNQYRTASKSDFNQHLTVTHLKGAGCQKYECSCCPYSTFSKGSLTKHSKTHTEEKDYQCALCKKQFIQKRDLDSHVLSNHADNVDLLKTVTSKIHRCELCSFKTIHSATLKKHVRSKHLKRHADQNDYQCTVCKKHFTRKGNLDSHILGIHADNVDLVKTITSKINHCESCSFKTVKMTDLKRHVQSKHI